MTGPVDHGRAGAGEPLVRVERLVKSFPVRSHSLFGRRDEEVQAIAGVSLELRRGETLGLVGETGCGKSTLARCVIRLLVPSSGRVLFDGHDLAAASEATLRPLRRRMQMVFQDPHGSLNPRRRVGSILADPFVIHGVEKGASLRREVQELMALVGLEPEHANRFPAEFSGGQQQRIGIARAIALRPDLVVCDEPVSALDVSIQAQILNLLADLKTQLGMTYLFISHDLSVVRHVCDRVAVMYLGKIVEVAPARELYGNPRHPYSRALLSAIPRLEAGEADDGLAEKVELTGDPPSPVDPPPGCRFHPRCPRAAPRCALEEPLLESRGGDAPDHATACHDPFGDDAPLSCGQRQGAVS